MTRLPRISGADVLAALQRADYQLIRIRGSHHYLRKPGIAGLVVVPTHGNRVLPIGTLRSIIRQAGLTDEEFIAWL